MQKNKSMLLTLVNNIKIRDLVILAERIKITVVGSGYVGMSLSVLLGAAQ